MLEEIAQLIARLDKKTPKAEKENRASNPETSFTSINLPNQIYIANVPLPVNIENQPVNVEQSGTWSVSISNQPISVTVTNSPFTVEYSAVKFASINADTAGDKLIVPAVSNKRIRVIAYAVVATEPTSIKFRSGTTDITGSMLLVQGGGIAHAYDGGLFQTAVNQPLNINLSINATVGGYVVYREVN